MKKRKRAIDFVREEMNKRREKCKTPEEEKKIDDIIELLNWNDYIFLEIDGNSSFIIFSLIGVEDTIGPQLYRELLSKENQKKYAKFKIDKKYNSPTKEKGRLYEEYEKMIRERRYHEKKLSEEEEEREL